MPILQIRKQRLREGVRFVPSSGPRAPSPPSLPAKLTFLEHLGAKRVEHDVGRSL